MKYFTLLLFLLANSHIYCQNTDFEATLNSTSFRFVERELAKDFQNLINSSKGSGSVEYRYNQWYFDLDLDVKNLSGELIEESELVIYLTAYFTNGNTQTFGPIARKNILGAWKDNETVNPINRIRLQSAEHFRKEYMQHTPENLYLSVYLNASNSIGYANQPCIIKEERIPTW